MLGFGAHVSLYPGKFGESGTHSDISFDPQAMASTISDGSGRFMLTAKHRWGIYILPADIFSMPWRIEIRQVGYEEKDMDFSFNPTDFRAKNVEEVTLFPSPYIPPKFSRDHKENARNCEPRHVPVLVTFCRMVSWRIFLPGSLRPGGHDGDGGAVARIAATADGVRGPLLQRVATLPAGHFQCRPACEPGHSGR